VLRAAARRNALGLPPIEAHYTPGWSVKSQKPPNKINRENEKRALGREKNRLSCPVFCKDGADKPLRAAGDYVMRDLDLKGVGESWDRCSAGKRQRIVGSGCLALALRWASWKCWLK
jgi:hypothetical protein